MGNLFNPTMFPAVNVVQEIEPDTGRKILVGYMTQQFRRFQEVVGVSLSPGAASEVLSSNGTATIWQKIVNANVDAAAAIAWSKISKTGSSLADLTTRSASDLTSGTLPHAQKWAQTTTTLTGAQDNVDFSNADSLLCNNGAALTIRGLLAGVAGQRLTIWAIAGFTVTLRDQNVNSSAANRIITGTGADVVLTASVGRAYLEYDAVTARWRVGMVA